MAPTAEIDKLMAHSSPEERKKGMEAWNAWAEKIKSSMVEMGAPLGKNKRVTAAGISDVRNEACGYTIVQAESHDEAAKLFEHHPHFQIPSAYIDILECLSMDM